MIAEYKRFRNTLTKKAEGIAITQFKTNFVRQGYVSDMGFVRWKPRKVNTKRSRGRAILVNSGRLKRGIRGASDLYTVRVANDVPYAKKHNEGFRGTEYVKAHKRKRGKSRFNVRSHARKVNIIARPFMITNRPLIRTIEKMVDENLKRISSL